MNRFKVFREFLVFLNYGVKPEAWINICGFTSWDNEVILEYCFRKYLETKYCFIFFSFYFSTLYIFTRTFREKEISLKKIFYRVDCNHTRKLSVRKSVWTSSGQIKIITNMARYNEVPY